MPYYTNKKERKRIDGYLFRMAKINTDLGVDSTEKERRIATMQTVKLEEKIRDVDPEFYKEIAPDSAKFDTELEDETEEEG